MGLFKKKPDPVSQRAKAIDDQIAAIQAEIKKLNDQAASQTVSSGSEPPVSRTPNPSSASAPPHPSLRPDPPSAIPKFTSGSNPIPRLRSTALPHRPASASPPGDSHEPVFEEVNQPSIKAETELPAPTLEELGTRKSDLTSLWRRLSRHFRGPVTSNPKLVNYLAAGSIQGLQPLRYEKRVARNRFMVFAALLFLLLWGLIAMLVRR